MKKVWPIVLLGILLLLIACKKDQTAETDLIFEGKTYVIGSGKPPKGQPMKMLIQQRINNGGNQQYVTIDSFYTNRDGYFSYRFTPNFHPNKYLVTPEPRWGYDNLDLLFPKKLGYQKQDFRILGTGVLELRIINNNYFTGDSLVVIGPSNTSSIFSGPFPTDIKLDFVFQAFKSVVFEFRLRRNGIYSLWREAYFLQDDSIHYHEVIY